MKRTALLTLLALFACGLAACRRETAKNESSEGSRLELFEKGRGIRLPDDVRRQLGVETAEVTERLMALHCDIPVHVFRGAEAMKPAVAVALVSEAQGSEWRPGQSIPLKSGRDGSTTFTGTFARLEPRAAGVLGRVEALIEFADPDRRFPTGSCLTASLTTSRSNRVSAIPSSAVVEGVEGAFVYTANGSHYTRALVKLGAASDGWVEVVDGLYAGDWVVTKGADTMWMIELCALKGGTPCCPVAKKN
jgi:multidrug efflux pump subunit AcrA (membrane-fusion protein)